MKELELLKKPLFWLALFLSLIGAVFWQWPENNLHLIFCNVGQGDTVLITYKSEQILIDGGPDDRVLDCLGEHLPFWDREIEIVVATHPEKDHIAGLVDVIERYNVRHFLLNAYAKDSVVFEEFKQGVEQEGATIYFPQKGDQIKLGPLVLNFLWPKSQDNVLGATTIEKETNDTSLVFQLTYGQFDALLTGDISSQTENQINLNDVEVLKVSHHGSKYSTGEGFLEESRPELAVISVGKNSFGHPTQEVIERLTNQSVEILRTDEAGEVEIVSDGEKWEVKKK